jgi:hypothetical protein
MIKAMRAVLALGGAALIGWGVYGLLHDPYIRDPSDVLLWAVGGLLIHDGLWLPLVFLVGLPLTRHPVLRGGLIVATTVSAVALPAVLRAGQNHGNATLLPLPYLHNLLLVLAALAVLTLLTAVTARLVWHGRAGVGDPRQGRREVRHASRIVPEAGTAVRAHSGQRPGPRREPQPGRGDRRPDGEQGARPQR